MLASENYIVLVNGQFQGNSQLLISGKYPKLKRLVLCCININNSSIIEKSHGKSSAAASIIKVN